MHDIERRWNPEHDPADRVGAALTPLRAAEWKNTVHHSRLERELREGTHMKARKSWRLKVAMITGIFLAGGAAGATGIALVERYFVEETDLVGPETHVRITDTETGTVVMDENIRDGDGLFRITEHEEGEDDTFLIVRPIGEPDQADGDAADAPSAPNDPR